MEAGSCSVGTVGMRRGLESSTPSLKNKQKATESERRKYANGVSREIELEPRRGQKPHTIGSIWGGVRALVPSPSSWARFKD